MRNGSRRKESNRSSKNERQTAARLKSIAIAIVLSCCNVLYHSIICQEDVLDSHGFPDWTIKKPFKVNSSTNVVLFYNAYIPMNESRHAAAIAIVNEQIGQIQSPTNETYELRFNTIGHKKSATFVHQACSKSKFVSCHHLRHYPDGSFEDVTLSEVYDYCQSHSYATVVYLHSKGTYHPSEMNDNWRRYMTTAAMSCIPYLSKETSQCNACGFNFNPIWTPAFFGNIWTAQCSYVNKLMPPKAFKEQADETADMAMLLMRQGRFTMNLLTPYAEEAGHLGRSRFADEHWVGSHPDLRPCDWAPYPHLMKWIHPSFERINQPLSWSMAPRRSIQDDWIFLGGINQKIRMVLDVDWRSREFFLIRGTLWKWLVRYQQLPPEASYVWRWFPDGQEWLDRYRGFNQSSRLMLYFLETAMSGQSAMEESTNSTALYSTPRRTFFVHLKASQDSRFELAVKQRLEAIAQGSPGATIFYGIYNDFSNKTTATVACPSTLDCRPLEVDRHGMDSVILTRLHEYCTINPELKVGFSRVVADWHSPLASLRREQTRIAAGECWQTDCDICTRKPKSQPGQPFPVPAIWLASCQYIKELETPNEYAARMSEFHWALGTSFGQRWILSSGNVSRCHIDSEAGVVERVKSSSSIFRPSNKPLLTPLNSMVGKQD